MPPRKKTAGRVVESKPGQGLSREERLAAMTKIEDSLVSSTTGDKIIRGLNDRDNTVKVFSTRCASFDIALGVGGIPRGRATEIFGPERSGKSTIAMQVAASAQEEQGIIIYIDSEHSLDAKYCKAIGLDIDDAGFRIMQEDYADDALDAATQLLRAGLVDLVVIDSIANLFPRSTSEKMQEARDKGESGVGKKVVGVKASILTQFFEDVIGAIHRGDVAMLNVQQMRTIMKPGQTPREDSATQIASVRHNTSVRVKVARKGDNDGTGNKTDETYQGESQETIARVTKNKVGPPFRNALYTIKYGKGVLYWDDLLDSCMVHGVDGVKYTSMFEITDTETGEVYPKFYRKKAEDFFAKRPEVGVMLVDKLSDKVGIHLWDPVRGSKGRRIGPYSAEELDAVGVVVEAFDPDAVEDEDAEFTQDDMEPIVDVL